MKSKQLKAGLVAAATAAVIAGCGPSVEEPVALYGPAPDVQENENWDNDVVDVYGPAPDFEENENWEGGLDTEEVIADDALLYGPAPDNDENENWDKTDTDGK